MRISGWHIDGFGLFRDVTMNDLFDGLVLFHGANESGKSTLLGFIRAILFGFPRANAREPQYPPLAGGRPGGRLLLTLADGRQLTVERFHNSNTRPLVYADDDEPGGEESLRQLLGGTSAVIFKNIYAFSLNELQDYNSISDAGLKGAIYGAGGGTAAQSLPEANKKISAGMSALFLPGGQKPLINRLLKSLDEVQHKLRQALQDVARYDQSVAELSKVDAQIDAQRRALAKLSTDHGRVGDYLKMWNDWLSLLEAEQQLLTLEGHGPFPEKGLERLERLQSRAVDQEERLTRLRDETQKARDDLSRLRVDEQVLNQGQAIESLAYGRERYEAARGELDKALRSLSDLARSAGYPNESGDDPARNENMPAEDTAVGLISFLAGCCDELRRQRSELHQLRENVIQRDRIDDDVAHLNNRLEDREAERRRMSDPGTARPLHPLSGLIFAAGALPALLMEPDQPVLAPSIAAGFLLLSLFVIAWLWHRRRQATDSAAVLAKNLKMLEAVLRELRETIENRAAKRATIQAAIEKAAPLLELTPPVSLQEITAAEARKKELLETAEQWHRQAAEAERTRRENQGHIEACQDQAGILFSAVGREPPPPEQLAMAVEALLQEYRTFRENAGRAEMVRKRLAEVEKEAASLNEQFGQTKAEIKRLLAAAGVADETAFRAQAEAVARERALQEQRRNALAGLRTISGRDDPDGLRRTLSSTTKEALLEKEKALALESEELEQERLEIMKRHAELKHIVDRLQTSDTVARLREEEEQLLAEIRDAALQWCRFAVAGHLLDTAREKYEREQQPKVVRDASAFFSRITADRYSRVTAPVGEDRVEVIAADGGRKPPETLSRGTAEQLYLALRFGCIRQRAENSEPLPVVMDDILVNFDPGRARRAAEAIVELAQTNQVLLFTCHPGTLALFKDIVKDVPVHELNQTLTAS